MKLNLGRKVLFVTATTIALLFSVACSDKSEKKADQTQAAVSTKAEQQAVIFQAGTHYKRYDSSVALENQVTEVFWYGCSHCRDFAPVLEQWKQANPSVKVRYLPVIWDDRTKLHARIFFLLQEQPNFPELHAQMFPAMTEILSEPVAGKQKIALVKLLVSWGIQGEAVVEALETDKYDENINAVTEFMKAFEVQRVPAIVVNDKYRVINSQMISHEQILAAAKQLLGE